MTYPFKEKHQNGQNAVCFKEHVTAFLTPFFLHKSWCRISCSIFFPQCAHIFFVKYILYMCVSYYLEILRITFSKNCIDFYPFSQQYELHISICSVSYDNEHNSKRFVGSLADSIRLNNTCQSGKPTHPDYHPLRSDLLVVFIKGI